MKENLKVAEVPLELKVPVLESHLCPFVTLLVVS